jgi:hypothetical protein
MAKNKKQALQEIYGDANNDDENPGATLADLWAEPEVTQEEIGTALAEIISELKAKYGKEWTKHIGEVSE